ncbi:PKD domain-containing protein [Novosphingobium piscinae]|uniref:PKD domain-containing protein n=1 Tax=Novosphingobium piscinae TaxID=1507448 RepID=A0A7X1FVQ4_9SPHN|nr:PKD domain-containing protein [Novosphingobium piscinae]MBC2667816.1 hypothetical protein [Novosphingobium piscinae]
MNAKLYRPLAALLLAGLAAPALGDAVPTGTGASAASSAEVRLSDPAYKVFAEPYIDQDEWRDQPVRHRYVHGGFKGTDARFSFYFPPPGQYQGRFFQHVTPVPGSENEGQTMPPGAFNKIGFAIASGAYFVETNGGGTVNLGDGSAVRQPDPSLTAYKANAAAALYSRTVARAMYRSGRYAGQRPYGYLYGGSGGAFRTIVGFESAPGVWDGAVPYVPGSPVAIPNMFTARIRAMRILDDKFPQIVDAIEPGGSGDPYAGLSPAEAAVLREVTRMGFPMRSWFGWKTMGIHGLAALYPAIKMVDAAYFSDFWTKPGYLGFDHPEQFADARLQFTSTIGALITGAEAVRLGLNTDASSNRERGGVDTAFKARAEEEARRIVAVRLSAMPPKVKFLGGDLAVLGGNAKGSLIPVARVIGDMAVLGVTDPTVVAKLSAGDEVRLDNSNFLALETYHWHQVPSADFKVWDQFRGADGKPLYPQRPFLMGPAFMRASFGPMQTGVFTGKMILMSSLWDREAMPWQADWYRQRIAQHFGATADQHVRLWYTDYAQHGDEPGIEDRTRTVSYNGPLQQALRDLSAWVERGVAPPPSTQYRVEDGQVIVAPTAAQRQGIQPVVRLTVNGGQRAVVKAGQPVQFVGAITAAPGGGTITAAEWDFDGSGRFATTGRVGRGRKAVTVTASHTFAQPGTWFVTLRGAAQRPVAHGTPYALLQNLDRVRVVVQ